MRRESSVEMLMSPNSLAAHANDLRTLTPPLRGPARDHVQKNHPNERVLRHSSAGARCQPYLRK
jgi:hypothetical protein